MSIQLTLAAGKDQLTAGKSGMYFIFLLLLFFTLCLFVKHYHYFWCGEFNFFCLFVLICLAFSVFILFYLFHLFYFFIFLLFFVVVVVCFFCFCCCCFRVVLFLFLNFRFELFFLKTFSISLLFHSPYSSYQL